MSWAIKQWKGTMKVFVTGVAGFLGSHAAERFLDLGWDVAGVGNLTGGRESNVPNGVDFAVGDCVNRKTYIKHLHDADVVFHCAWAAYDGCAESSPSSTATARSSGVSASSPTSSTA